LATVSKLHGILEAGKWYEDKQSRARDKEYIYEVVFKLNWVG